MLIVACRGPWRANKLPAAELLSAIDQLQAQGKTAQSRQKAEEALMLYGSEDPYWRFRFGLYLDPGPALAHQSFLTLPIPDYARGRRAEPGILWDRAEEIRERRKSLLDEALRVAESLRDERLIAGSEYRLANYWLRDEPDAAKAGEVLELLVQHARRMNNPLLLTRSLVNLSVARMRLDRHDETIALCQEAARLLGVNPDDETLAHLETNLGWSWLQLGDGPQALQHFDRSVALFKKVGKGQEVNPLRNQAAYFFRQREFIKAQDKLTEAEPSSERLLSDEQAAFWADRAEVYLMTAHPDGAREAINKARRLSGFQGAIRSQEDAHIRFVESALAENRHDIRGAEAGYREVLAAPPQTVWSSLRLEAAIRRSRLLAAAGQPDAAERQFADAENVLEAMRGQLNQDESKLSFFEDSATFYDQYVDFLAGRGDNLKALQVADRSRARLLSDYQSDQKKSEPVDLSLLQSRLRLAGNAVALFYWIGEQHAYLWIIGAGAFERVDLTSPMEIRTLAQKYFESISTERPARDTGLRLRDILLAPARRYLKPNARVFMMLDDKLGLINPESLPGFNPPSYWIDEAIVSVAPSLAVLQSVPPPSSATISLLAIGDAIGTKDFPKLPNAARELDAINKLFPNNQRDDIRQERAKPAAYRNSNPIRYEMIHFTAHGRAEANNPLDSAVILSPDPDTKAFKLYARDIIKVKIQARLVTISACRSAASRTYRGEGVVGLAWAFLRAGAGQVVAGLWNVDDEATQELMVRFYKGMLEQHQSPAVALREAKRGIMKGFPNPYYWAPFEIFAGYIEP